MSAECEFLTIPDNHFGAFGSIFPELNDPDSLLYEAIEQPLEYARENGIHNLFFLGDLFDDPDPSQTQINRLIQFLVFLAESFSVHVILGNHDYLAIGKNSMETVEFVNRAFNIKNVSIHMKPERVLIDGVPFSFLPWPHFDKKKAGLKEKPSINIAHVKQYGALTDSGMRIKQGGVKLNVDDDWWVIGDLHRKQTSNRVFYPGTLYQKNFGEPLPKGFGHYTATYRKAELRLKEKWIPMEPPFVLHNIKVETPEDLKLVLPQIEKRPLLRYKLFVKNNVALPPNFLDNNPHVVKVEGWRTKQELEQIEKGSVGIANIPPLDLNEIVYADLSPFLKTQGLNKAERDKAKHIIDGFVHKLTADVRSGD
jgi:hypothetical protein